MKRIVLILLSLSLFVACPILSMAQTQPDANPAGPTPPPEVSTPPAQPAATAQRLPTPPEGYKLQPDDAIRMQVFGEPDLTVEQVVNPGGYVTIPLIGQIYAKDLTQAELTEVIKKGLSKYLVEPKVQLTLSQIRMARIFVLGQVNRPGPVEYKSGQRIMEAVAGAGSFTDAASLETAMLTHRGSPDSVPVDLRKLFFDGDMTQNLSLQDGDTIFIPEDTKNKYFVLGEVIRPMMYHLKTDVTVMDAITTAGGPTPRGSLKNTYIIRGDPRKPQRIKLDLGELVKNADVSQNMLLQPGDVVYVAESSKPDWSRIGNILSIVVNSSYLFRYWGL